MDTQQINRVASVTQAIISELRKTIVGQDDILTGLMASLYANGHCLLVGVPGLAKTLLVQSLGASLSMQFSRIQFTPDLMPSDILGSEVIHENNGRMEFQFRQGPVFTNLLLADEINRTPPKTQSALLEAMQERRVTIAGQMRPLPQPFLVVATQNPIEQEGTYPLPEAQLDRFMFALELGYPSRDEEVEIVTRTTICEPQIVSPVISAQDVSAIQKIVRAMPVALHVIEYAVDLTKATRPGHNNKTADTYLEWGAGPRASQYLILGAKAFALMEGRAAPEAKDVVKAAPLVLSHRVVPNFRATGEGLKAAAIVQKILEEVKQPTY
jgi:MoxR-like ATPase